MNIFFLSLNPRTAAEHHCDKHVVKMILESAQLLYCAQHMVSPQTIPPGAYKKTHPNHPCGIWVRESMENYMWLCELGLALCAEYTFRYGRIHKTQAHLEWLNANPPPLPRLGITVIRQAMPIEYKRPDPVDAYRAYYLGAKQRMLNYTKRSPPEFILNAMR
jgi:hypothetical protein